MAAPSVTNPALNPAQIKLLDTARNLLLAGQFAQAEAEYRNYQQQHPPHPEVSFNLGLALHRQGRLEEAILNYQHALRLTPNLLEAYQNLGHACHTLLRLDEAMDSYRRALEINPDHAEIHNNLGNVLKEQGELDQAIQHYEQALRIKPQYAMAHSNLGNALRDLGLLDEALACYQKALGINPNQLDTLSNLLFVLSYHPSRPPEQYLAVAHDLGARLSALASPYTQWSMPTEQPLRVGLVSGDMRTHPVGFFLENIVQHLNPGKVTLFAYHTKPQEDALTTRLKSYFHTWRSLSGLSDQAVAQQIHADGIHILLDLAGHTAHNRLPVFAWKPAPVQISWLGYFASTGMREMDAVLADPISVPKALRSQFTEHVFYLPDTRLCFTPPHEPADVSILPALRNGFVTLGSFQNLSKISIQVLMAWSKILAALPTARLRLQNIQFKSAQVREFFLGRLQECSIPENRVELLGPTSRATYLAAHHETDLLLDTFPYPGGTTTCEALWMGVPTLTLAGGTMLGRQGASMLAAAGLDDWIAKDEEDYVNKAVAFASDLPALAALRSRLRLQVLASPLFDGERFARNLENVLLNAWQNRQP